MFFAVNKKIRKDFTDSIFMRVLVTIWTVIICLKLKQYEKFKYTFSLLDYKIILQRFSFKRILFFNMVRYKIGFLVLWIFYFLNFVLIPISLIKFNNLELCIRNIFFFQKYIWIIEAFVLIYFPKKTKKIK
jgi:hypothetical protein